MEPVVIGVIVSGGVSAVAAIVSAFSCYRSRSESSSSKERETSVKITNKAETSIKKPDGSTKTTTKEQTIIIDNMKMEQAQQMTSVTMPVENKTATAIGSAAAGGLGAMAAGAVSGMIAQAGSEATPEATNIPVALINAGTGIYTTREETKRAAMEHGTNQPGVDNQLIGENQVPVAFVHQQIQNHGGVTVVFNPEDNSAYIFDSRNFPTLPIPKLVFDNTENAMKLFANGKEIPLVAMDVHLREFQGQYQIAVQENKQDVDLSRLIQVIIDSESGNIIAQEGNQQYTVQQIQIAPQKSKDKGKEKENEKVELKNVVEADEETQTGKEFTGVEEEEVIQSGAEYGTFSYAPVSSDGDAASLVGENALGSSDEPSGLTH